MTSGDGTDGSGIRLSLLKFNDDFETSRIYFDEPKFDAGDDECCSTLLLCVLSLTRMAERVTASMFDDADGDDDSGSDTRFDSDTVPTKLCEVACSSVNDSSRRTQSIRGL